MSAQEPQSSYEKYYSPEELANLLSLPISSVYRMLREGKIHGIRVGILWRVSKVDLDSFIQSCQGGIND